MLTEALVAKFASRLRKPVNAVSEAMLRALQDYDWPGNVRELENFIERAVILSTGPTLHLAEPLSDRTQADKVESPPETPGTTLDVVEAEYIRRVLRAVGWRIEGKEGAALRLGLNPSTLRARMRKLGILRFNDSRG